MFFEEKDVCVCYDCIKGFVVNFVLCEGNSDCCVLFVVKNYVKKYLYCNKLFVEGLKICVVMFGYDDFKYNECFWVVVYDDVLLFWYMVEDGIVMIFKEGFKVFLWEIIDVMFLFVKEFDVFFVDMFVEVKIDDVFYLVYFKVIMMKVSDLIIFGYVVKVFFKDVFD